MERARERVGMLELPSDAPFARRAGSTTSDGEPCGSPLSPLARAVTLVIAPERALSVSSLGGSGDDDAYQDSTGDAFRLRRASQTAISTMEEARRESEPPRNTWEA